MAAAPQKPRSKPASPAVQKAFAIIELFATENRSYTISEISRTLKYPLSTTSALLHTMQQCGYVTRSDSGFSLSTKLLTEATRALNQMQLHEVADAELHRLVHATGLTAVLLVRDNDQVVCIAKVEGHSDIRVASYVGRRFHMHFTSTGKAILAHLPDDEVLRILTSAGLPRNTPKTITTVAALKKELQRIQTRGYAIDDEEFATHIRGVGAAVFDHSGRPIAGIAITGGADEVGSRMSAIAEEVRESARALSRQFGHTVAHRSRTPTSGARQPHTRSRPGARA